MVDHVVAALTRARLEYLLLPNMYGSEIRVELIDEAFMIGTSKYVWRQHREAQVAAKFDAERGGNYETSLVAHKARDQPLAGRFAKYTFGDAGQLPPVLTDRRCPGGERAARALPARS